MVGRGFARWCFAKCEVLAEEFKRAAHLLIVIIISFLLLRNFLYFCFYFFCFDDLIFRLLLLGSFTYIRQRRTIFVKFSV